MAFCCIDCRSAKVIAVPFVGCGRSAGIVWTVAYSIDRSRIEDVDDVTVGDVVLQHEPVGSRWQDASRDLDRLAKGELSRLIILIGSSSWNHDDAGGVVITFSLHL
jgi:hypothetical protein